MMRAGLVAGIYSKTLDMPVTAADPTAAITLMSTDVERITNGTTHIHETWANIVEVAIAIWLLERQLGVACVVPVVFGAGEHSNPSYLFSRERKTGQNADCFSVGSWIRSSVWPGRQIPRCMDAGNPD